MLYRPGQVILFPAFKLVAFLNFRAHSSSKYCAFSNILAAGSWTLCPQNDFRYMITFSKVYLT